AAAAEDGLMRKGGKQVEGLLIAWEIEGDADDRCARGRILDPYRAPRRLAQTFLRRNGGNADVVCRQGVLEQGEKHLLVIRRRLELLPGKPSIQPVHEVAEAPLVRRVGRRGRRSRDRRRGRCRADLG